MRSNRRRGGLGLVVLVALLIMVWGGIAAAQTTNDTTYPTISTSTTDPCTTTTSGVCSTSGTVVNVGGARASSLPFTGGDVALLTVLGLAALGSGVAIVLFSRRRSTSSA